MVNNDRTSATTPGYTSGGAAATSSKKSKLLQVKSSTNRKKKKLFDELSFVENHMDTFYVGLNDNANLHPTARGGSVHAKLVDIDQAYGVVKEWVQPDSQLVRCHSTRGSNKKCSTTTRAERTNLTKLKPSSLRFVQQEQQEQQQQQLQGNDESDVTIENDSTLSDVGALVGDRDNAYEANCSDASNDIQIVALSNIFDDMNTTAMNDHEQTLMTPSRHRVFVDDTPVDFYGLSIRERRRLGFKF